MSTVTLKDTLNYVSVSDINASSSGKWVRFETHEPVLETNGYSHKTFLRHNDEIKEYRKIDGDIVWKSDEEFYYAVHSNEHSTLLYRSDGVNEACIGEVPYRLSVKAVLNDGALILFGKINISEKWLVTEIGDAGEAYRKTVEQDEDCFVIDEFPYWSDGEGVINKWRNQIFIYSETEGLRQLTDDLFDVKTLSVSEDDNIIYYSGSSFEVQRPLSTGLYRNDISDGKTATLIEQGKADIADISTYGEGLIFAGNLKNPGISFERGRGMSFYRVSKDGKDIKKLASTEISYGGSVFSDVVYGGGIHFQRFGDKIYFLGTWHERVKIYAFTIDTDAEGEAEIADVIPEFDGVVHDFSVSDAGIWFSALSGLDHQELYLADGVEVKRITELNTARYADKELSVPESLEFEDGYGQPIIGYVLKPAGYKEGRKYPAILDIHGGPRGAYGAVYFHEMQYWAAQGYFVFFCNPTGGTGRGSTFGKIVNGTGGSDYEDIMQFTDLVLDKYPDIDRNRLGVTGGSYGGFMTNWIIGHTDRFAAAASQRSTANNITEAANKDMAPGFIRSMTEPDDPEAYEKLWALSPLKYIGKHTVTPTLFLHSLQDYRCYHVESLQMYAALQYLNVPTRMILFKNEHHGLSRDGHPRNRLRRIREITDWMDKYLKRTEQ